MARNSLKIVNSDATINEDGYVAVVEGIVLNPQGMDDFIGEEEDTNKFTKARTKMLKALANSGGGILKQLDDLDAPEPVASNNCRIRAQLDVRKDSPKGFSKITVTLPEETLDVADLEYIDKYILKYLQIRAGSGTLLPVATTAEAAKKARKFMFGAFMLTKCR